MRAPLACAVCAVLFPATLLAQAPPVDPSRCAPQMLASAMTDPAAGPHWNGWGVDVTNTRFQSGDQAGLTASQVPSLKLKWAFGFPDASTAYGQPTVAAGRVFVGSQNGTVYSLDAKTGCTYWTFKTQSPVRAAATLGPRITDAGARAYTLYVADQS